MGPILLKPFYVSPIWAGTRIAQIRDIEDYDATNNYGEAFDVSAHPTTPSIVENGKYAGMPLAQLIAEHHDEVIGDLPDDFTVQITWMDPIDNLSVQVHPDEDYAQRVDGDHGKTESWYIAAADEDSTLIAGPTTTNMDALRAASEDDSIGEKYSIRKPVKEGDFVFVPAGTMHALGPGCFAVEVGSFGNLTYRLCDWGRGREIHIEKALDVLKPTQVATVNSLGVYDPAGETNVREGVSCELFTSNVVDINGSWTAQTGGRYQIVTCVKGGAHVETAQGTVDLAYTRSALIPACIESYTISGNCRVLQSFRP